MADNQLYGMHLGIKMHQSHHTQLLATNIGVFVGGEGDYMNEAY